MYKCLFGGSFFDQSYETSSRYMKKKLIWIDSIWKDLCVNTGPYVLTFCRIRDPDRFRFLFLERNKTTGSTRSSDGLYEYLGVWVALTAQILWVLWAGVDTASTGSMSSTYPRVQAVPAVQTSKILEVLRVSRVLNTEILQHSSRILRVILLTVSTSQYKTLKYCQYYCTSQYKILKYSEYWKYKQC